MIWAASLVQYAVMLQEFLELLGTVEWTVGSLDYMRQTQFCDNHRQFYAHSCGSRIGQFLTRIYLEKTSATIRKSILSNKTNQLSGCAMEMGIDLG